MNDLTLNSEFADKVAQLCYQKFDTLPKSGKPINKEWTLLAAVVKRHYNQLEIVSLATGSKCIGKSKMSPDGDIINDSHAEVLARRGFMRYLYEQIELCKQNKKSIFETSGNQRWYKLIDNITFHLFISHVPCGDAAIFPKLNTPNSTTESRTDSISFSNRKRTINLESDKSSKIRKLVSGSVSPDTENVGNVLDIHRTGAKCLPDDENQDKKSPGLEFHVLRVVRTKPGRGDRTLSVSCSDKILRWNFVGMQGALLSLLIHPIYLSSITVATHEHFYSHESMNRAVLNRSEKLYEKCKHPVLLHSEEEFKFSKRLRGEFAKPSPCGIIWYSATLNTHEVCVEGHRLGYTKKKSSRTKPLLISKKMFLHTFKLLTDGKFKDCTYSEVKLMSTAYQHKFEDFKRLIRIWTQKDVELLQFK